LLEQAIGVVINANNTDLHTVRQKATILSECSAVNITLNGKTQVRSIHVNSEFAYELILSIICKISIFMWTLFCVPCFAARYGSIIQKHYDFFENVARKWDASLKGWYNEASKICQGNGQVCL